MEQGQEGVKQRGCNYKKRKEKKNKDCTTATTNDDNGSDLSVL